MPQLLYDSAASRALRIPIILREIFLQHILESLQTNYVVPYHDLLQFALVNSLWETDALRLLWQEGCNDRGSLLSKLCKIPANRLQKYANYVKSLTVGYHVSDSVAEEGLYRQVATDSEWDYPDFKDIRKLAFPCLESLTIQGYGAFGARKTKPFPFNPVPLDPFLDQGLAKLDVVITNTSCYVILEDFVDLIEQKIKRLKDIVFRSAFPVYPGPEDLPHHGNKARVSPARLAKFLNTFQSSLERFRWDIDFTAASMEVFMVLSSSPHLKDLDIPVIEESWLINDSISELSFSKLEKLKCFTTGPVIQSLASRIRYITDFDVCEAGDSSKLWDILIQQQFQDLTSLRLLLHQNTLIYGKDLISVVSSSQNLETLWICGAETNEHGSYLFAENFDQDTIESLARYLPQLRELYLLCYSETEPLLPADALVSLARFCPLLESCSLVANINWEQLLDPSTPEIVFPNLTNAWFSNRHNQEPSVIGFEESYLETTSKRLGRMMPLVGTERTVSFQDSGNWHRIIQAFMDISRLEW